METLKRLHIDQRSNQPIADQLFLQFYDLIITKEISYTDILPSIESVSLSLAIDQNIVKKAYDMLIEHALIKLTEKDTYLVTYIEVENHYISSMMTVFNSIKKLGKIPSEKILESKKVKPSAQFFQRSGYYPNESIYLFKRIFYADDKPLGIMCNYISITRYPDFLKHYQTYQNIYDVFKNVYHIKSFKSNRLLSIITLSKKEAELLLEQPQTATYKTISKLLDHNNQLLSYAEFITSSHFALSISYNI